MSEKATIIIGGVEFTVQVPSYIAKEIALNLDPETQIELKRNVGEYLAERLREKIPVAGRRSTEKQMNYAIAISHILKVELPDGVLSQKVCSDFIGENDEKFKIEAPKKKEQEDGVKAAFKTVNRAVRLKKARDLLSKGEDIEDVAEKLGVTSHTIKSYLVELSDIEAGFDDEDSLGLLKRLIAEVESGINLYDKYLPYNPSQHY